jgi:hypothetical protein
MLVSLSLNPILILISSYLYLYNIIEKIIYFFIKFYLPRSQTLNYRNFLFLKIKELIQQKKIKEMSKKILTEFN